MNLTTLTDLYVKPQPLTKPAMGHPVVYLNLDKDMPKTCSYCGLRYFNANHH